MLKEVDIIEHKNKGLSSFPCSPQSYFLEFVQSYSQVSVNHVKSEAAEPKLASLDVQSGASFDGKAR